MARRILINAATLVFAMTLLALPLVAYAATGAVSVKDFSFQPKTITIHVGDLVTWTNNDTAAHTVTSTGNWDTGSFGSGASRSIRFIAPGTYAYFCLIHSIMFGSVVVLAADAPTPTVAAPTIAPTPAAVAAATPSTSPTPAAVALSEPAPAVVLRPPSSSGPGPIIVAAAAMAIVALMTLAWLVARQA